MGLWTHGMRLGGRQYAKRYRTAQGRAGAGQQGEDGDNDSEAGGHRLLMVMKRLYIAIHYTTSTTPL